MTELAAIRTPFSQDELLKAVSLALMCELGHAPSQASVAVLCAQIALETANGAACIQWNVGNYKRPDPAMGDYCTFVTTEDIHGVPVKLVQPFACYPNLAAGCIAFVHSQATRWALAWPSVLLGDPKGYALGLHAQKPPYYTADPDSYAAGVSRWFSHYMSLP